MRTSKESFRRKRNSKFLTAWDAKDGRRGGPWDLQESGFVPSSFQNCRGTALTMSAVTSPLYRGIC